MRLPSTFGSGRTSGRRAGRRLSARSNLPTSVEETGHSWAPSSIAEKWPGHRVTRLLDRGIERAVARVARPRRPRRAPLGLDGLADFRRRADRERVGAGGGDQPEARGAEARRRNRPSSGTSIGNVERVGDDLEPVRASASRRRRRSARRPRRRPCAAPRRLSAKAKATPSSTAWASAVRSVCVAQADEAAADGGIVVRRALAAEVGKEHHLARRRGSPSSGPGELGRRCRRSVSASHSSAPAADRITPIWCQVFGTAWQKAWTALAGIGREARVGDEQHAGGAERDEGAARRRRRRRRRPRRRCRRRRRRRRRLSPCPSAPASSARSVPVAAEPSIELRHLRARRDRVAASSSSLQSRAADVEPEVPEASDMSEAWSPVSLRRT